MSASPVRVGGLMSGTSLDGTDVVVMDVSGDAAERVSVEILGFRTIPHPPGLQERLRRAIDSGTPRELARLHRDLGDVFARAMTSLLAEFGISGSSLAVVGTHGQTVWHDPPDRDAPGATLQLGCAATLAEALGVPVVHDFRSRDVAAGGHGAPLVPWADWVLLRRPGVGRALQNLGGMGNVTFLPADPEEGGPREPEEGGPGEPDGTGAGNDGRNRGPGGVVGFDTGPGVALLDAAARRASGGREAWDVDGRRAARGSVRSGLLAEMLSEPFFQEPPPRSTGRETFGEAFLDRVLVREPPETDEAWDDILATLTELTARSVAEAYRSFLPWNEIDEVVLTGGGARNPALVGALRRTLDPLPVRTGPEALGIDPDAREAVAFALLAWAHLKGIPGNLPQVTGATGPRVLGSLTPGRIRSLRSDERGE